MQDLERDLDREDARTAGVPHTQSERGLAWPESHRRRELYHTHTHTRASTHGVSEPPALVL